MKAIRLIYPQWQGANIARWIPDLQPDDASRGYYLGALFLEFLAPQTENETYTVPVSSDISQRIEKDGVLDRDIIALQTKAALDTLRIANPDKVVTLGGECSVSVPVFTYLADLAADSNKVVNWLKSTGKTKVMIHFDMDVMDPSDILAAVADGPEGGLKLTEVVRLINDIANAKELVALTVAEPMPRLAIKLKRMLADLPLMK